MRCLRVLVPILLLLLSAAPGFAEGPTTDRSAGGRAVLERIAKARQAGEEPGRAPAEQQSGSGWILIRGLGVSFGMLGVVIFGLKKMKPKFELKSGSSIRVIERLPVSPKVSLMVVEFEGRRMLVGLGPDSVQPISTDALPPELSLVADDDEDRFAA